MTPLSRPAALTSNHYVLFRSNKAGANGDSANKPAFTPVLAQVRKLAELETIYHQVKTHWGGGAASQLQTLIDQTPAFGALYEYEEVIAASFGFYGLFVDQEGLQALHFLLPFMNNQTERTIPLLAFNVKAPWNSNLRQEKNLFCGLDLAAFMHGLRYFYQHEQYSNPEEIACVCSFAVPSSGEGQAIGLDLAGLVADVKMFPQPICRLEVWGEQTTEEEPELVVEVKDKQAQFLLQAYEQHIFNLGLI